MSHQSRLESPTKIYHVYGRGVDKKDIFCTKDEKNYFYKCMFEIKELYHISIYAYCIMSNHYHLMIEGDLKEIAGFMQNCQGRYGITYNAYHARDGHVFQGKYKSRIVITEKYFWSLMRYIHLNPVKAQLVVNPNHYRWSSYYDYFSHAKSKMLLSPKAIRLANKRFPDMHLFQQFHDNSDHTLFDDIEEDVKLQKYQLSLIALNNVKEKTGIASWEDVWNLVNMRVEIVLLLMNEYHYNQKEICELLHISEYKLRKALNENNLIG